MATTAKTRLAGGAVARYEPAAAASPARAPEAGALGFAIAHGEIGHVRRRPVRNAFAYPAFCLRLPLSRLSELRALGVAHNARGAVSFHDRDHGPCDGTPLLPWIRALVAAEGIAADGEVVLHAFPRMLGYAFNPIALWVCHDRAGAVRAVLAEVRNTFGERHNYLLAHPDGRPIASGQTLTARKAFHVSPFCTLRGHYAFRFRFGAERWLARIDYFDGDDVSGALLETWFSGHLAPLRRAEVRALFWRYRWFTAGVIARIHWQALKLWVKRAPSFTKPAPPPAATTG